MRFLFVFAGQILGADGCTDLYAACPAIKSTGSYQVPKKDEFLPGVSLDVSCATGFRSKKGGAVAVDCLSNGKWNKEKGSTGYYGQECEKCAIKDCADCSEDASKCVTCSKDSNGNQLVVAGSKCSAVSSCVDWKNAGAVANGLYTMTIGSKSFETYCDFKVNGGGWTLVASVHEDNIRAKCSAGDLWTNTNGNNGRGTKVCAVYTFQSLYN